MDLLLLIFLILRGQFVRGWANTKTGTGDDGRGFASSQDDQNKSHSHSLSTASLTGGIRKYQKVLELMVVQVVYLQKQMTVAHL